MAARADAELRVNWRANWLSAIQQLADVDMQRATWLNPRSGNPHFSFVEYVECYFGDLLLGEQDGSYAARVEQGLLSAAEATVVSEFHSALDRYEPPNGDDYDHQAILDDPAWHGVVEAAKEAQHRLARLLEEPTERARLLKASEHAIAAARP